MERQYYPRYNTIRRAHHSAVASRFRTPLSEEEVHTFVSHIKAANPGKKVMWLYLLDPPAVSSESTSVSDVITEDVPVCGTEIPTRQEGNEDCVASPHDVQSATENITAQEFIEPSEAEIVAKCLEHLTALENKYPCPQVYFLSDTIGQADNDNWFEERKLKAPASKARTLKGFMSRRSTDNGKKHFLQQHLWRIGSERVSALPAVKYGKEMETKAREKYILHLKEQEPDLTVEECGAAVNGKKPQLVCSPDALVKRLGILIRLVEIKCPQVLQHVDPHLFHLVLNKSQLASFFLKRDKDGTVILKQSSEYYYQVQQNLYILDIEDCDFVVYSPVGDPIILRIKFNPSWWEKEMVQILKSHRMYILPEFYSKRCFRNMPPLALEY